MVRQHLFHSPVVGWHKLHGLYHLMGDAFVSVRGMNCTQIHDHFYAMEFMLHPVDFLCYLQRMAVSEDAETRYNNMGMTLSYLELNPIVFRSIFKTSGDA